MLNIMEVHETNKMIEQEKLDVRTITMGISLLDCAADSVDEVCENIYNKITTYAKDLVSTGQAIERDFGIPIVNKRITVTPISLVGASSCKSSEDFVKIAHALDRAAKKVGVDLIGGYSALVSKSMTPAEEMLIRSLPQALSETDIVCSSVNVGSTKTGIDMNSVELLGHIVKDIAHATADNDSYGCVKFVAFCNAPDDNPFMAGGFHGVTEGDAVINVGVSGPGVVSRALDEAKGKDFEFLCETIKRTAFKITRVGQLVAQEASRRLGVPFGIIDLSLAPTPAVGDSVGEVLEKIGLEQVGAPGTTAALAMLNDQVKKGGIMASSYVGGLSGAFIPVSEDKNMIDAANNGCLKIEKLEAMTCVCSVGLDMIAIPGDTTAATISGIIADEAAIGMVNQKTTAVRVIPVEGKGVGQLRRPHGLRADHSGEPDQLRGLRDPWRPHSGADPLLQELTFLRKNPTFLHGGPGSFAFVKLFLLTAGEVQLSPGFVDGDGGAVGEIQATQRRTHRQTHLLGHMRAGHDVHRIGDIARFRTEQQDVGRPVFDVGVQLGGVRGEGDDARIRHRFHQILEIRVQHHMRHVMVVEPRTAQLGVAKIETQRFHQVQNRSRHGAQADRGTRVARNTRGVVAQVRGGGLRLRCVLRAQHRVHHGNRIAVRVGHQFVRAVIGLAVPVFEHLLDLGFGRLRLGVARCALRVIGMFFVRHKC